MPCESEYLHPTWGEVESKNISMYICYVYKKLGKKVPEWIKESAEEYYGNQERLYELREILIKELENIPPDKRKGIFDIKNKIARKLFSWAEDEREERRKEKKEKKKIEDGRKFINNILCKLRKEEVEIINKYIDWNKIDNENRR